MDERDAVHVDQQSAERVELAYTLTVEDFRQALRARAKVSAAARRQRVLFPLIAAFAVVAGGLSLAQGEGVPVPLVAMLLAVAFALVGVPWLQARQFHRLTADKGEFRVVADSTGITVANLHSTTTLAWAAAPRHVETHELFVLFSGDKNASCLTVLPKRGTDDVDGLRALLARHRPAD
ncbi:hypothetical protein [Streptomyces sp. NRRL B-24484]|uniref:hypothetical protein n=1 Tax=Streptomyces sp. NRRL B-24484 TaxID=1463833 RepID=UPI0007C48D1C|nr:hypothetical protein [Streptomyces sp. NRRL B-24484]